MNLILLGPDELGADGRAVLRDRRLVHLREVLRAQVGDVLCVGVAGGKIGQGTVTAIAAAEAALQVTLETEPPAPLDVVLALALPRPPTLRKVLQQATALGVKRFALFRAQRVERSYFSSHGLRPAALADDLHLGLEQARDTIVPTVEIYPERFASFARERLPALAAGRTVLVAHPGGTSPCPRGPVGPVTLVVGPEGGLVPDEVAALTAAGQAIDLGPRILRVETAVVALLARLSA